MEFTEIDLTTWKRTQTFMYFSKMSPTGYSLTVKLDVTGLRETLKDHGLKFYPAYLWLVTKNLNKQEEFKIAYSEEKLGFYDTLTPMYAIFHDDDKTFSMIWTEYSESFKEFYNRVISDQKKFAENHGFLAKPEMPPANTYTVSCLPWVEFEHFAVHSYNNPYFFPSVEAGKFHPENDKMLMSLSITCHHAATDGYHVNKFLEELQDDMNNFSVFIN